MPNAPQIVKGNGLLAALHDYNTSKGLELGYSGSNTVRDRLRVSTPMWLSKGVGYPDGDMPVVCAMTTPLVPAFFALAPRGSKGYFGTAEGGLRLLLASNVYKQFLNSIGYVAVVDCQKDFTIFEGAVPRGWPHGKSIRVPEMRSSVDQTPLFNMEVTVRDFWQLLADDPSATLELLPEGAPCV